MRNAAISMSNDEVRQAVKETLADEGKKPLSMDEKEAAKQLFEKVRASDFACFALHRPPPPPSPPPLTPIADRSRVPCSVDRSMILIITVRSTITNSECY